MKRYVLIACFTFTLCNNDEYFWHTLKQINTLMDTITGYQSDNVTLWRMLKGYMQSLRELCAMVEPADQYVLSETIDILQKTIEIYDSRQQLLSKK